MTHFQRFRRRGDPRALGAVFDATAPELLRAAVHLVGDASLAEDAVQETFRVAIERRDEYDAQRPLVPWLAGILANQARSARRRRSRGSDPDESLPTPERDPGRRAVDREVDELVQAAIDSLPEDLRQVLTLNLRHGLAPAEIAHALGLSPSTVRSRLARGRERLRDRLPAEAALSAALGAPLARGLGEMRAAVLEHAAALAPPATVTLAAMVVTMKFLVPAAMLMGAATLWWSSSSSEAPRESVAASPPPVVAAEHALDEVDLADGTPPVPRTALEPEREVVHVLPSAEVDRAPVAPSAQHEHRHEQYDVEFAVVDAYEVPIPEATIRFTYARAAGTSWGWGFLPSELVTDAAGRARLSLPDSQYGERLTGFGFDVLHTRFAPLEGRAEAQSGVVRLVLEPGVFVIATGWIGSPQNVVTDVRVEVDTLAKLKPEDWTPLRDQRLACGRLQTGPHVLYLTHTDDEGRNWFSRLVDLELAAGEQREVHVELLPARQVRGALDPAVPRPVENGRVAVCSHNAPSAWDAPVVYDVREAEVAADGTFVLEDVPPQFLDVMAVCDGWTSTPVAPDSPCGRRGLPLFTPDQLADELLVPMQPSATLEVSFVDPDGNPLPDAWIMLHPNVHWNAGFTTILFDKSLILRSDAAGRAVVANLAEGAISGSLGHADYEFTPSSAAKPLDDGVDFQLTSGETLHFEARMAPKSPR